MKRRIQELSALEQLSGGGTCIHRLHPDAKLLATAVFVIAVVSFGRCALLQLAPYALYPALLMLLSETPHSMLLKRFMIAFPFCFFAGISNVFFMPFPDGAVSFLAIIFRAYLCAMAVLLLVSSTPFFEIANSMRRIKIPNIFIVIFEMTYRYICVLLEEAYSMRIAYSLRSAGRKGIKIGDMGCFAGQLLLRSYDRAGRVYSAMSLRGYSLRALPHCGRSLMPKDIAFFAAVCAYCAAFRFLIF